jgi:uncharacterized protein YlxW (UPF0749 family)
MNRTWLIVPSAIALVAVAALAQARPGKKKSEVELLREEVVLLREQVRKLEARVKELEDIFEDDEEAEPDQKAPLVDLAGPEDLKKAFLAAQDKSRLVLFLSPT